MSFNFPTHLSEFPDNTNPMTLWATWIAFAERAWKGELRPFISAQGQLTVDFLGTGPDGQLILAARYILAIGTPVARSGLRLITVTQQELGGSFLPSVVHGQTHTYLDGIGRMLSGADAQVEAERTDFIVFAGEWPDVRFAD